MERTISDEEKIRRAIEISERRNNTNYRSVSIARVNLNEKKEYRLFRKMILQIIICFLIYIIFYLINSTNYVFSTDVIKSANEILNYDINFPKIYNNLIMFFNQEKDLNQVIQENVVNLEDNTSQNNEQVIINNSMENKVITENTSVIENIIEENTITKENLESSDSNNVIIKGETAKSQMELDAEKVLKICQFQKPLSGKVTSEFGEREVLSEVMSADHKGIDIAANSGTSIKAAMSGTVTVAEENSEYGKFIKIVNQDVMTVYAHCKKLKVKVGDEVKIGQTIATVGSTGKSTGPHLHFEIRLSNRYINPRLLIDF